MAIKLLDVPDWKLLDGEEDSKHHDFLLISHDQFFARDVQEFAGFIAALADGTVLRYLLRRPAMALRMMKALGKHSSPLEIPYFSAVPYLRNAAPDETDLPPDTKTNGEATAPNGLPHPP